MDHVSQTSPEVARQMERAYLPVGSFEQHGPHLPLDTDSRIALAIACTLATSAGGLVLPSVPVSCSHEHADFPGTVSVDHAVAGNYISAIVASLVDQGYEQVILVSGHGGNYFLQNVAQTWSARGHDVLLFPTKRAYSQAYSDAELTLDPHSDMHAGEYETSLGLHLGFVRPDIPLPAQHRADERDLLLRYGMRHYAPDGYIGDPSSASSDKGSRILDSYRRSFEAMTHRTM